MRDVPSWVFIVFAIATAVGVLLQAFVLLGLAMGARKAKVQADELIKQVREQALPMLATARNLLEDVSPKLKVAAQNVVEASQTLKVQAVHVNEAVDDLLKKTESQADRVDEMITGTLNSVAHATATLQRAVSAPVRQVGAVLNGLRVGFDVLRSKERETHVAADGDHFV